MDSRSMSGRTERVVLVLQGGGALGAYQAGAYDALCEAGQTPDWVAGISIGAINAAIIAGNRPDDRHVRLRTFWERVSSQLQGSPLIDGTQSREVFNYLSAAFVSTVGVPGFFEPRFPPPQLMPPGSAGALSVYDTAPLRDTLLELIDFDYLNQGHMRLSVGAVNIRTGNFAYFDSHDITIRPEHIMASGALPPGLPPIVIDGEASYLLEFSYLLADELRSIKGEVETPVEVPLPPSAPYDRVLFEVDRDTRIATITRPSLLAAMRWHTR